MEAYKQDFIEFMYGCFVEDLEMLSNAAFYGIWGHFLMEGKVSKFTVK